MRIYAPSFTPFLKSAPAILAAGLWICRRKIGRSRSGIRIKMRRESFGEGLGYDKVVFRGSRRGEVTGCQCRGIKRRTLNIEHRTPKTEVFARSALTAAAGGWQDVRNLINRRCNAV